MYSRKIIRSLIASVALACAPMALPFQAAANESAGVYLTPDEALERLNSLRFDYMLGQTNRSAFLDQAGALISHIEETADGFEGDTEKRETFLKGISTFNLALEDEEVAELEPQFKLARENGETSLGSFDQDIQALGQEYQASQWDLNLVVGIGESDYGSFSPFGVGTLIDGNEERAAVTSGSETLSLTRVRLSLDTSFTGNDQLRTRLTNRHIKTAGVFLEYENAQDDGQESLSFINPVDVSATGLAFAYTEELDLGGGYTSTGLGLGGFYGLDAFAENEFDIETLRLGVQKDYFDGKKFFPDGLGVRSEGGLFHRNIDLNGYAFGDAVYEYSDYYSEGTTPTSAGISQNNEYRTEVKQTGVFAGATFDYPLIGNGFDNTLYVKAGGAIEIYQNDAEAEFVQQTWCSPCSGSETNSSFTYVYDESDWEVGGKLSVGVRYEFLDTNASIDLDYERSFTPGVPVFSQAFTPMYQPSGFDDTTLEGDTLVVTARLRF